METVNAMVEETLICQAHQGFRGSLVSQEKVDGKVKLVTRDFQDFVDHRAQA